MPRRKTVTTEASPASLPVTKIRTRRDRKKLTANPAYLAKRDVPPPPDMVNHPPYYQRGGYECIDVIEALQLPHHLAEAFAYIWRAGIKDRATEIEDLKKAQWYINRYIEMRQKEPTFSPSFSNSREYGIWYEVKGKKSNE